MPRPPRALCLVLAILPLAACAAPSFRATPRYGTLAIDGEFGISSGSVTAGNDLQELGLEDDDGVFGARVEIDWGSPNFSFALSGSDHGGDGTLEAEISQGGTTIPAGEAVHSDFELGLGEAALTFDLVPGDLVDLGIGVGVLGIDLEWAITSQSTGDTIDTDEFVFVPVLALRGATQLGPVELSLLASGLDVEVDGDEASVYDLDFQALWRFTSDENALIGALVAGWRYLDFDLDYESDDDDEVDAEVSLNGPYLGLTLGF